MFAMHSNKQVEDWRVCAIRLVSRPLQIKPQVRLVVFASCTCEPTNTMHISLETEIAISQMDIGPNS